MTERTSDGLPLTLDGKAVTWDPWETFPAASHLDMSCSGCGADGPPRLTKGRVMIPAPTRRQYRDGAERPLIRFWAFRCPGCQETRVYDREPTDPTVERMTMLEYLRPVIEMKAEPLPQDTSET